MINNMSISHTLTAHSSGYRARYSITIDDGRVFSVGPVTVQDNSEAMQRSSGIEANVITSTITQDAEEAVRSGIKTAHKTATLQLVQYTTLRLAYNEPEYYKAYQIMKDVAPELMALEYTNEQYAEAFNSTVEDVINIKSLWQILDANSDTLQSYIDFMDAI
jgi:hypothetical protein